MGSPLTVNATPTTVALSNTSRVSIRFQNVGETDIYLKKNSLKSTLVSSTDYEVLLKGSSESSSDKDPDRTIILSNDVYISESMHSFSAISNAANGKLAIFETSIVQ